MEAPPLERKLVAILAADVAGYSRMMHRDEDATLATLTTHRTIIDDLIATGRGQVSGTAGDSVLAEFASVVDAVHCAVAIQQALHKANADLPAERRMRLRIGINIGDVLVKDGTIFGDGVNVAARLESLAEPGSVCITRGVRDHIRDRGDYEFEDLGEHSVKNIARPVRAFRILFDPDGTTELREAPAAPEPALSGSGVSDVPQDAIELEFWQSVQASGEADEYGAYLERYPDGIFAPLARDRLAKPETLERPPVPSDGSAVELAFWDTVKDSDNPAMFRAYLERFPDGVFKALAQIRLAEIDDAH
ncbi:adenylate cyclase [Microvirga ossetica]|uniref:Adenylate cyclase n=1 Tax=Microvirga ossetica TaxID=1882682 RepID=A0A1B2EQ13_9HYPH|nr:adenylate/guanylate cyclase domain-containing protein [Microvirga ossetica]ANY82073.1 adenylate cyclase [Microvirga ossetica]